jgi:hypothetical protein
MVMSGLVKILTLSNAVDEKYFLKPQLYFTILHYKEGFLTHFFQMLLFDQ